jgi:5'-3' exoribonuclease 2
MHPDSWSALANFTATSLVLQNPESRRILHDGVSLGALFVSGTTDRELTPLSFRSLSLRTSRPCSWPAFAQPRVPALFRWLSQKYPKITTPVIEELPDEDADGTEIPVDWTLPNPNKWELDNLYLDMNGIIHPCCHPEDKPAPDTEDAMFVEIFAYIDRIMAMTRPRKVVYMAIDGVAPRAKMNQQRSRRFRAAQEAYDKAEDEKRLKDEWEADHDPLPEKIDGSGSHTFDSNCITPGTPFMANLAVCLRYYITDRMGSHPAWKGVSLLLQVSLRTL